VLSKILAGVLAVGVLSVGGFAYWQYADCPCDTPTEQPSACPSQGTETSPCCLQPLRGSLAQSTDASCSKDSEVVTSAETLAIPPREVE